MKRAKKVKKIVMLGGGHGMHQFLLGARLYAQLHSKENVVVEAICANTDKGGTTKEAVEHYDGPRCLGDVSFALTALVSERIKETLNYRYTKGPLKGWTPRHVLLQTLLIKYDGDLDKAIEEFCIWCQTGEHRVRSITSDTVDLRTECLKFGGEGGLENFIFHDEGQLDIMGNLRDWIALRMDKISLTQQAIISPYPDRAVRGASLIVIPAGSFPGSILACLLVKGVKEAFAASKAPIVFFLNIFRTPRDPTFLWNAEEFVNELEKTIGKPVNYVIGCSSGNAQKVLKRSDPDRISYERFQEEDEDGDGGSRFRKFPLATRKDGRVVHDDIEVARVLEKLFVEIEKEKLRTTNVLVGAVTEA